MEHRLFQENLECKLLVPYATKSKETKGRTREEIPCDIRTDFQRDRDRIVHCKAFRRMKHKTQVFISPEGDHYRTRLTHTLEVAQIARTISRALRLNEDLTEAIALGHDLGHTPFGHGGEKKLDDLWKEKGGFAHNTQSLRVVDRLEKDGAGLNLTWEVRNGIWNHRTSGSPATPEGRVVQLSDKIAYTNHDIDDAIRGGLLCAEDIPRELTAALGDTFSKRINTMIRDTIANSEGTPMVSMSPFMADTLKELRAFMFQQVYECEMAQKENRKVEKIIGDLYAYYLAHPMEMEGEFIRLMEEGESVERTVCDYIACMTDRFAVKRFEKLFVPEAWSVL